MKSTRASVRYAKALKELALEQGELEQVCRDMKLIFSICKSNRDFLLLLKNPIIKTDKKQSIIQEMFGGKITRLTELFMLLLTAKRREAYLETIALEFIEQYKEHKKILTAVITTVTGIDEELRKKILEFIKSEKYSEIELIEKTDARLVGGFTLQMGTQRIDASIAKEIRQLTRSFSENPYIKEY